MVILGSEPAGFGSCATGCSRYSSGQEWGSTTQGIPGFSR